VRKMRPGAGGIDIQPGQTGELTPRGSHAMLVGLKHQREPGQHFKVTREFARAGKVDVDFAVEGIGAQSPAAAGGGATPGMGGMKMK
jgi:copper(I)-binding protein